MNFSKTVLEQQFEYMQKVKALVGELYGQPKACVNTFGCQQNVSDSEHIKGMLEAMGYTLTDEMDDADFVLFNTCAVREHAQDRVYGNIGITKQLKKARSNMVIAVCGCMAQQQYVADRIKKSYPYVDILFGTHVTHKLPEFLYKRLNGSPRIFDISTDNNEIIEGIPVHRDKSVKGWLPIMYGCNNFCTYCVVPYVRGRERSRTSAEIIKEAKIMIESGVRDITLLGQNVNSYGKGLDEDINFAKLLRKLNDLPGEFRLRFMTSHPKDCTKELLDTMAECEKVAHHLHLPVQCGNDRVLKEMNRHYDRDTYLSLIDYAKAKMPDLALTSDIIVGFPGETYDEFCDTLSLIKEVEYNSLFTFIYSPRPGTPAAELLDPISRAEKGKWFSELLAVQDQIGKRKEKELLGKTFRVLCEEKAERDGYIIGRTNGTAVIEFEGDDALIGTFADVKVTDINNAPTGVLIKEK
ncbi:MAG: tRNA (N6-isopentenyl adenosine(37)-C2)-methylthiotransferase MiaB [Acutalibacteraceae bacterium]|nr:tRNA (N6-isopentenyl adenosine(37)-C2)-methylthiotransferase MiaB [Acutalibacteraceae bacterium]